MNCLQHHGLVKRGGRSALRTLSVLLILAAFAFSAAANAFSACLPPAAGQGEVAGVSGNGVLLLKEHRTVKLEGLLWPAGERDGAPDSVEKQALDALRQLTTGRRLVLRTQPPKLDRYGRLRAQLTTADGTWLQREIVRRGWARVSIAPDRRECARELYAAEAAARDEGAGLWAFPAYAVRAPESLRWRDLGTFQIVEGKVLSVKVSGGRAYLDFGRNWRTDFTLTIAPADMKVFRRAGVDPYRYTGNRVRVRGYIDRLHGFEIAAASPEAIEVISATAK